MPTIYAEFITHAPGKSAWANLDIYYKIKNCVGYILW